MYSKADYLKNFQHVDSDELLDRLARCELTPEARGAIRQILIERGCRIPDVQVADISDQVVLAHALAIRNGACPVCRGSHSAVDFRTEHWVWSAILLTRFGRREVLACRDCGRKRNLKALGMCTLLGWWGIPFGLLITPYKIIANLGEMLRKDRAEPSNALRDRVRVHLAASARP